MVDENFQPRWNGLIKMLDNLRGFLQPGCLSLGELVSQLRGMEIKDVLVFLNGKQDAALVFIKQDHYTLCESFHLLRHDDCGSYPGWAIEISDEVFHNKHFQSELAKLLLHLDSLEELSDENTPFNSIGLIVSILRGVGLSTQVPHTNKHVRAHFKRGVSDRSRLWLLIKVAISTFLDQWGGGGIYYKVFMLHVMCGLAMDALDASLSNHLLHAISSKILRRLGKLGSSTPKWLQDMVLNTNSSLRDMLEARWREATAPSLPALWKPSQLDLDQDTRLFRLGSSEYIQSVLANHDHGPQQSKSIFSPEYLPRGTLNDFLHSYGLSFEEASNVNRLVALHDVEQRVEDEIDDWIACVVDVDEGCAQLVALMWKYLSCARYSYRDHPERISIMLLTAVELWVALDKLAVGAAPILAKYSPELSTDALQKLLLRTPRKLHRLGCLYQYLSSRHSHSVPDQSMFSEDSAKTIFDTRPFVGSLDDVERPDLLLVISEPESIIFPPQMVELLGPISLHMWRFDTSYLANHPPFLDKDNPMHSYLEPLSLSQSPALKVSFRPKNLLGLAISWDISGDKEDPRHCYYLIKFRDNEWMRDPLLNPDPYPILNPARTPSSNDVLAAQAQCPDGLSLQEYSAFGHLRSGSLQWLNVLRELRSRTLNFHQGDVYDLLAQVASQVGPLDLHTAQWEWHQELNELPFCFFLLDELENLLMDVAACSQDGTMMKIITLLLSRILSSSPSEGVSDRAVRLLHCVQKKTFYWVRDLLYDFTLVPKNDERKMALRDMAIICQSMFNMGPDLGVKVVHSAEGVATLILCSILIHATCPVDRHPNHAFVYESTDDVTSYCHLSFSLEGLLRHAIEMDVSNQGIDLALSNVWSAYRPGLRAWQVLPPPDSHWLSSTTITAEGRLPRVLHLNLLDGMLLVDGRPIDRLPHEIRRRAIYRRIFSDSWQPLVVASNLPGMDFCTLTMICDHHVHFVLRDGNLIIRVQHKDAGDILEAIPQKVLWEYIPKRLLSGHVYWLNLSTSIIEIRPCEKPWEESPENWRIDCRAGHYRMYKGDEWVVDIKSPSYSMVSTRLKCLDVHQNLRVTTLPFDTRQSLPTRRLSVVLSRYSLSFFVNEDNELESHDFNGMVYDEDQCIGTLFGLKNRLVLKAKSKAPTLTELIHRCVIIPHGSIHREQYHHHARISIFAKEDQHIRPVSPIKYYTYRVNTDLGCLTGDGSGKSRKYLADLHFETSFDWIPDPLTSRTGVHQSLHLLQPSGCRSTKSPDTCGLSPYAYRAYPQLIFAVEELIYHENRDNFLWDDSPYTRKPTRPELDRKNALRTAYLFPLEAVGPAKQVHGVCCNPNSLQNDDFACVISSAVYHWLVKTEDWTNTLEPAGPAWENLDFLPPMLIGLDVFFRRDEGENRLESRARAGSEAMDEPRGNMKLEERLESDRGSEYEDSISSMITSNYPVCHGSYGYDHPDCPSRDSKATRKLKFENQPPSVTEIEDLLHSATQACQRIKLLFLLPTMVQILPPNQHVDTLFLSILVTLAKQAQLKNPPRYDQYSPSNGFRPSWCLLMDSQAFATGELIAAWPFETVPAHITDLDMEKLDIVWDPHSRSRFYHNFKLKEDLTRRLQEHHSLVHPPQPLAPRQQTNTMPAQGNHWWDSTSMLWHEGVFGDRSPPRLPSPRPLEHCHESNRPLSSNWDCTRTLNKLFSSLRINETDPQFRQQYIARLHSSAPHSTWEIPCMPGRLPGGLSIERLWDHHMECSRDYFSAFTALKNKLHPSNDHPFRQALHRSGQLPTITPGTLLQCLATTSPVKVSGIWKSCIISLALLLIQLQRSRRLLRLALDNLGEELSKELENEGCDGWSAADHPDWLLIQIQGDFLIRKIQASIAMNMISPRSGNTTMQVDMGEGKSSVILPICATTLADGNQLVRVIVPRALTAQMFQILVNRISGLANRTVYFLPFSRGTLSGAWDKSKMEKLQELLSECMHNRGVLVVQPEHVLSLKLTGVEQLLRKIPSDENGAEKDLNDPLLELQRWIHSHSRDILDECDEIFHPRSQLIYTIGHRQHIQASPDRWAITQQMLRLVRWRVLSLAHALPDAVEYEQNASGSFPRIRILPTSDVGRRLLTLIVEDVMDGRLPGFTCENINGNQRLCAAVREFISCKNISQQKANLVEDYGQRTGLWDVLLLLRGLLACNVLLFGLVERRWRIDYGLILDKLPKTRNTKLAVPYGAKDVPAERAKFGHPDLAILLTCLSYYYGGLTEDQLRTSFQILQDQDNPYTEYANWLQDFESVPAIIQDLKNVNIKSSSEIWDKYLYPLFVRHQAAVDFYLSQVVFPKEACDFPSRLSASCWDLAEVRKFPTTGFSGTNDGQYLLPTSISQRDPDYQRGSNARVLSHLLRPENNCYRLISHPNGERRTTLELLDIVAREDPKVHVLLDVGAQILDLSNHELAKAWLNLSSDYDGAIYFDSSDMLDVLTKDGVHRPLRSSPLVHRLDRCVIYLDHAHTRGTDLKLPLDSRAAVTLGAKVTKDHLVQGCMRMRKLGHGHSVMFLVPLEVDRNIRTIVGKEDLNMPITTTDILRWAIQETWVDIQRWAPHWAQQGIDHIRRYNAWSHFCADHETSTQNQLPCAWPGTEFMRKKLLDSWLRPESKTLANLYAPTYSENALSALSDHQDIQQRCRDLGVLRLPDECMDEEQEREVNREIERERQVQELPLEAKPLRHSLHPDVAAFVKTGEISEFYDDGAFLPVSQALRGSSAAITKARIWSPFILATSDFCKTVDPESCRGHMDPYLRPVHWVLSGKCGRNRVLVLVSPFEADRLMPDIRISEHVHLHVYTPRTSERMRSTDDLMFYAIPPLPHDWSPPWDLIDQLNIFAGQLYLRDYQSYLRLRALLGIQDQDLPKNVGVAIRNLLRAGLFQGLADVFTSSLQEIEKLLIGSPLPLVVTLLRMRRKGLGFAETHMGRILQGEHLTNEDFKIVAKRPDWAIQVTTHDHVTQPETSSFPMDTVTDVDDNGASLHPRLPRQGKEVSNSDENSGRVE